MSKSLLFVKFSFVFDVDILCNAPGRDKGKTVVVEAAMPGKMSRVLAYWAKHWLLQPDADADEIFETQFHGMADTIPAPKEKTSGGKSGDPVYMWKTKQGN